jgi:hypothetical protein
VLLAVFVDRLVGVVAVGIAVLAFDAFAFAFIGGN